MPDYKNPRPCPRQPRVPPPTARRRSYGIFRVAGQPGGNGATLRLERSAGEGGAILPDPGGFLTLAPGRLYGVSLLIRGVTKRALDSFDQGVFTVTPVLDSVPAPELAASGLLPMEGSAVSAAVSAVFLLPPVGEPVSFALLARTDGAGVEAARPEGTVSVWEMG